MKHNINHRLLKYKLSNFDYSKINNKAYFKRYEIRLKANYIYNTLGLEYFIKYLTKQKNIKIFRILQNDFKEIYNIIKEKFNLMPNSELDRQRVYELKYNICKCKECNKQVEYTRLFCSNKCSNNYKAKDENFIKTLSESVKKWHSTVSAEEKEIKKSKISKSVIDTVYYKSSEERKLVYGTSERTAFDNLGITFPKLNILFNKEEFYSKKYLKVQCKDCNFIWEMTKTTSYARTECKKCNPYKKHKTQTEIFNFIIENGFYAKENDKSFISNEIDINVKDMKLCIEYNGLLSHSFGKSKISYYNKFDVDEYYHLRKTLEVESKGYELLHIFENEFLDKTKKNIWFSIIKNKLNLNKKINLIDYIIRKVEKIKAKEFLENNHLEGFINSKEYLGLYVENELKSLICLNKNEILRICNKVDNNINSEEIFVNYLKEKYKTLIIRLNRRFENSKDYVNLGFRILEDTEPRCFYFRENENILYNDIIDGRVIYDCGERILIKDTL